LSQFKKYHPSENLKFNNLGISQSLKFRVLTEKILSISLKLNFTPNTLDLTWIRKCLEKKMLERTKKQIYEIRHR